VPSLFLSLTPYARVATALIPFVAAILVRILMGKNRVTGVLISIGTVWFMINILLAPYSVRIQQDLLEIRYIFR
jgi:hypothetical protein